VRFLLLPLLLLAVVCGVTTVTGALLGGFALMLLPIIQSNGNAVGGLVLLVIGLAAVGLGRDPNGLVSYVIQGGRHVLRAAGVEPPSGRTGESGPPGRAAEPGVAVQPGASAQPGAVSGTEDLAGPQGCGTTTRSEEVRTGGTT
jgi:branched-chain amino acid transport system permease protein